MKILWVCNTWLPQGANLLNINSDLGGGWLVKTCDELLEQGVEIVLCSPLGKNQKNIHAKKGNLSVYSFPRLLVKREQYLEETYDRFNEIITLENPDIIHIFGTEYPHALACVNSAKNFGKIDSTVINIQGLIGECGEVYYADLPKSAINGKTLRDFITNNNIKGAKKEFLARGEHEKNAIKNVKHIVGRTHWDKEKVLEINENINYYHCNETLRSEFYNDVWGYDTCEKYSIFASQCSYPLKGFHYLLWAMPNIIKKYPLAKIYVTGANLLEKSFIEKQKGSYYELWLAKEIKRLNLENYVVFTGGLNASKMKERYLKSNVFVSSSVIENSPNSVGEAMLLGVPCVCSNVGGTSSVFTAGVDGISFEKGDVKALESGICDIFANNENVLQYSKNARNHAILTHDAEKNTKDMMGIYSSILSQT